VPDHATREDRIPLYDAGVRNKSNLLGFCPCDTDGHALEPDGSSTDLGFL